MLTLDIITVLAYLSLENPNSDACLEILRHRLSNKDQWEVAREAFIIQGERKNQRRTSLSPKAKKREDDSRQRMLDNPFEYYGTIGLSETTKGYERYFKAKEEWTQKKSDANIQEKRIYAILFNQNIK